MTDALPRVSVVLPVHNEAELLPELHRRLGAALQPQTADYELVFVNDGSTDGSLAVLKALRIQDPRVVIISLSRNFGHQAALNAGLEHARGSAVVLMDADLQDPPEIVPHLLSTLERGWDVVYAVRRSRREFWLKQLAYAAFYRLAAAVSRPRLPLDAGDFSIVSRRAADLIVALPERTRFLRGLRTWIGLRQTSYSYDRDKRTAGRSKYSFPALVLLAVNGIITFSHLPLRLASVVGVLCACASVVGAGVAVYLRIFTDAFIPGWTSLVIIVFFLGGMQLLALGVLGEYIARIYDEVKHRPLYIVDERLGGAAPGVPQPPHAPSTP